MFCILDFMKSVLDEMIEPVYEEINLNRVDYQALLKNNLWDFACSEYFFEYDDLTPISNSIENVTGAFIHHIGQFAVIEQMNAGIDFFTGQNGSFSELTWVLCQTDRGQ